MDGSVLSCGMLLDAVGVRLAWYIPAIALQPTANTGACRLYGKSIVGNVVDGVWQCRKGLERPPLAPGGLLPGNTRVGLTQEMTNNHETEKADMIQNELARLKTNEPGYNHNRSGTLSSITPG